MIISDPVSKILERITFYSSLQRVFFFFRKFLTNKYFINAYH